MKNDKTFGMVWRVALACVWVLLRLSLVTMLAGIVALAEVWTRAVYIFAGTWLTLLAVAWVIVSGIVVLALEEYAGWRRWMDTWWLEAHANIEDDPSEWVRSLKWKWWNRSQHWGFFASEAKREEAERVSAEKEAKRRRKRERFEAKRAKRIAKREARREAEREAKRRAREAGLGEAPVMDLMEGDASEPFYDDV